jgi:hypothetical protein
MSTSTAKRLNLKSKNGQGLIKNLQLLLRLSSYVPRLKYPLLARCHVVSS